MREGDKGVVWSLIRTTAFSCQGICKRRRFLPHQNEHIHVYICTIQKNYTTPTHLLLNLTMRLLSDYRPSKATEEAARATDYL